jgi:exonuclease III
MYQEDFKEGATLQASRQSQRLRNQGGISVEEMATKRKKKQNLEMSGNKNNPFIILNNIDDDDLIRNAKDLDIILADDEKGQKE